MNEKHIYERCTRVNEHTNIINQYDYTLNIYMYVFEPIVYIYVCVCVCVCIYIYMHIILSYFFRQSAGLPAGPNVQRLHSSRCYAFP